MRSYADTQAPDAPSAPSLDSASDSDPIGDGQTNINTPVFTGTAESFSTVTLSSSLDGEVGSAVAGPTGDYSIQSSALNDGCGDGCGRQREPSERCHDRDDW